MKRILVMLVMAALFAISVTAGIAYADKGKPPTPGAAHEKVTLCHRTGSDTNPYVEITVNFNSVEDAQHVGGHVTHSGDIIPPFTYSDSHGSFSFAGQGDQAILRNGCKVSVPTTTPTTTSVPPTTTAPTTTAVVPPVTTSPGTTTTGTVPAGTTTTGTTTPVGTTTSTTPTTTNQETTPSTTTNAVTPPVSTTTKSTPLPTPKQLKTELRKQATQPGTGRIDTGVQTSGNLPHTGLPLYLYALIGLLLIGVGLMIRRFN